MTRSVLLRISSVSRRTSSNNSKPNDCRQAFPLKENGSRFLCSRNFLHGCLFGLEQAEGQVSALLGVQAQAAIAPVGPREAKECRVEIELVVVLPGAVDGVGFLGGVRDKAAAAAASRIARIRAVRHNVEPVGGASLERNRRIDNGHDAELVHADEGASGVLAADGHVSTAADAGAAVAFRNARADVIA